MAVFTCPQCGHSQAVDDKHVGKSATCPKCKAQGVVQRLDAGSVVPPAGDNSGEPTVRHCAGRHMGVYYGDDPELFRNTGSTLSHEWIVLDDPRMTVHFSDVCGVTPTWDIDGSNKYSRAYLYTASYKLAAGDLALTAIEVRFLTFDVWGSHVATLSAAEIKDIAPHSQHTKESTWKLYSESEAWHHFASIGYVARVRSKDGNVINADAEAVLREAQRFTEKFTEADLEPTVRKKDS
jgi:hypothetical protein